MPPTAAALPEPHLFCSDSAPACPSTVITVVGTAGGQQLLGRLLTADFMVLAAWLGPLSASPSIKINVQY